MLFPVIDLNVPPEREINFGVGFGLTPHEDRAIVNLILARRISRQEGPSRGIERDVMKCYIVPP